MLSERIVRDILSSDFHKLDAVDKFVRPIDREYVREEFTHVLSRYDDITKGVELVREKSTGKLFVLWVTNDWYEDDMTSYYTLYELIADPKTSPATSRVGDFIDDETHKKLQGLLN
jgi:hypothetical protein